MIIMLNKIVHYKMGKNSLALEDFNAALKIAPKDGVLYYNRGIVYLARGEKAKAKADLEKASKLGHKGAAEYLRMQAPEKKTSPPVPASG